MNGHNNKILNEFIQGLTVGDELSLCDKCRDCDNTQRKNINMLSPRGAWKKGSGKMVTKLLL